LQMFEPGVGGLELVAIAQNLAGRLVEQPHAFVGLNGKNATKEKRAYEQWLHDSQTKRRMREWRPESKPLQNQSVNPMGR